MTTWQPYPSSATAPAPSQAAYEPYPTQPQYQVSDSTSYAPSQPLVGYVSYADPYATVVPRPTVTAPEAFKLALKNWKNFSGRASRSEFWYVALAWFVVNSVSSSIASSASQAAAAGSAGAAALGVVGSIFSIVWIATLVPMLSLAVRRFHDTGRSGWFVLLSAIPLVGMIITALMLAKESAREGAAFDDPRNQPYGPESL